MEEKKKKKTVATAQRDLGSDSGDETRITSVGMQGNKTPHTCSSSTHVSKENDKRRSDLFHIGVVSKHTVIADFTTLGESHIVWPSPVPLQTHYILWTICCLLMYH